MFTKSRAARLASATTLAGMALALSAATASAAPVTTAPSDNDRIIGGTRSSSEWVVQLSFGKQGSTYGCSGEAISSEWILTARHCAEGISWMNVYYSNSKYNPGPANRVDQVELYEGGDIALVHLATAHPLRTYGVVANSYTPQAGDTGTIWGYGNRANGAPSSGLYSARVSVLGDSTDAYYGPAVHIRGITGASNHGDSGGPLVINGEIVAVCSTGDQADPGANIRAQSNYANLTDARGWITQTAGV